MLFRSEERNYRDELGQLDVDQISCDGYEFGMDLAFGILEENEENADRYCVLADNQIFIVFLS